MAPIQGYLMFRREVFYCILCIVVLLLVTVNVKHTAFKQQWVVIQEMALKNFSRFILFFFLHFFIIMVFLLVVSIGRKEKKHQNNKNNISGM